jgi:hypothetical protein
MKSLKDVKQKMLEKLRTSLLSPKHAELLHLKPLLEDHELNINPRWAGFQIPYFLPNGRTNGFYRFRYLQYQPSKGFGAITEEPKKPRRYAQPKDSQCHVYMPPLLGTMKWATIMEKPSIPVCITEGELKAACACANGVMPTLGLGGVYNWKSTKQGLPLIQDLEDFQWEERKVYLCFDTDIGTNPMVAIAASQLARTLTDRGAIMMQVELDGGATVKQGLDDYAFAYGVPALTARFDAAKPIAASIDLHNMNLEVALIRETNEIVCFDDGCVFSAQKFTDVRYKNRKYPEPRTNAQGQPTTPVMKYTAKEWLEWPHRLELRAPAYVPGQPSITADGDYNTWTGWATEPRKGSVQPWQDLLAMLMSDAKAEHTVWLRQWFAYPLAFPGTKLYTAIIMWGVVQGTGKTLLGDTMRRIYGRNYRNVTNNDLLSQYNDWVAGHQFIVGDEISTGNKRGMTDSLKDTITREHATVNLKYRPQYTVKDCNNYYFTSNHPDAFFIEDHDRRYFVHEVTAPTASPEFYARYLKWLDAEGGASQLFHYFLNEVDLTDFDPKGRAPETLAKREMMRDGKSDIGDWVARLKESPDSVLKDRSGRVLTHALWTSQDLLHLYDPELRSKVTANGLSRELKSAGFRRVASGNNTIMVDGARTRLWALRNGDRLSRLSPVAASKLYTEERANAVGAKFEGGKRVQ